MRNYYKEIPPDWHCEECNLSSEMVSPKSGGKDNLSKVLMSNSSSMINHNSKDLSMYKKLSSGSQRVWWEKEVGKGKTKYISAQEAIKLSSGAKKFESSYRISLQSSKAVTPTIRTHTKLKNTTPAISSCKVKRNLTSGSSWHSNTPRPGNFQINPMVQQQVMQVPKEVKEEHAQMGQPINLKPAEDTETTKAKAQKAMGKASFALSQSMQCQPLLVSEPRNVDAKNRSMMDVLPAVEKYLLTNPAPFASWKGSFKLKHPEISFGILAHPPSRVLRKVYEFSKKMPEALEFELLPCQKFWMNIFRDSYCPDRDDIGLYFLPCQSERSENYTSLLEYLSAQDSAMRCCINNVELLVFSSRLLHVDSRKWNKNYFLWGLYRCIKLDDAHCANGADDISAPMEVCDGDDMAIDMIGGEPDNFFCTHNAQDNNAIGEGGDAIDMDIDMIGGNTVGRLDIAVSRKSLRRGCEISGEETSAITLPGPEANFTAVSESLVSSSVVKREICSGTPPGFCVSLKIENPDNKDIVTSRESFQKACGTSRTETCAAISSSELDATFAAVSESLNPALIPLGFGASAKFGKPGDIPPGFGMSAKIEKPGDFPPGFDASKKIRKPGDIPPGFSVSAKFGKPGVIPPGFSAPFSENELYRNPLLSSKVVSPTKCHSSSLGFPFKVKKENM